MLDGGQAVIGDYAHQRHDQENEAETRQDARAKGPVVHGRVGVGLPEWAAGRFRGGGAIGRKGDGFPGRQAFAGVGLLYAPGADNVEGWPAAARQPAPLRGCAAFLYRLIFPWFSSHLPNSLSGTYVHHN